MLLNSCEPVVRLGVMRDDRLGVRLVHGLIWFSSLQLPTKGCFLNGKIYNKASVSHFKSFMFKNSLINSFPNLSHNLGTEMRLTNLVTLRLV